MNTIDKAIQNMDVSYPAEVFSMQKEIARIKKLNINNISIRRIGNDKYEFSNKLGDSLAEYDNKSGKLLMY